MIVKLFGIMDLFAVAVLLLLHFSFGMYWKVIALAFIYLAGKGLLFFGDIHSHLDLAISLYLVLLALVGFSHWFTFIPAAYLGHKGVRSLL
ncbi:hypothetical protein D6774_04620 [Candidatus Woesearchaeota archaeon]|nr:MAG: hypothetical protein D6774_04620 [Candidatus Woesearchaeota archaeon]